MSNICVVGLQWGDEGKGKIVDLLTSRFDIVARYQGGSNAGHTVVADKKYVLHLIPSGILHPACSCVIGNGVVIDPEPFLAEVDTLSKSGIDVGGRLWLSDRAHLVMPWHKVIDKALEASMGSKAIGTTGRGIGPCYTDKVSRSGIRVGDLMAPDLFRRRVREVLEAKNQLLVKIHGCEPLDPEAIIRDYLVWGERIRPYVLDTIQYLHTAVEQGKSILFEGAQGSLLDVDFGTYPYVTSSNSTACGVATGIGVSLRKLDEIDGVLKAYTTRVGSGPFPTEDKGEDGKKMGEIGHEFGATTGRPRRCGWLDIVALKYALSVNDIDRLIVTKLDVLDSFERIRVCTGYRLRGVVSQVFPSRVEDMEHCEPVYEDFPGWMTSTASITKYADLPSKARGYLEAIERLLGKPIRMVGVGAGRGAIIEK
ncbi:MAG: adenylosuccinate synthase [Planctomycetota bacterium]